MLIELSDDVSLDVVLLVGVVGEPVDFVVVSVGVSALVLGVENREEFPDEGEDDEEELFDAAVCVTTGRMIDTVEADGGV